MKDKQDPKSETRKGIQISTYHFRILATLIEVRKEKEGNEKGKTAEKESFEKGGFVEVRVKGWP